ncbi:hypothetical protein PPACK8108_LOCUS3992 [Phakopsora pachyrhizi]|uniref:Uncharacterized protein n=1 Tax=Phakopsora pachyrhizi TaxID=170000 RepID=A0AAV0ANR6_PHAPC|nr:hypothetical protein PPACK8108_LOCUS3992 [Phakopsora pachyrhizi]
MTSSTGAFQGKLWKICVVDLQQGLAWLCWAGELSPRQGQPGLDLAWLGQGQVGQTARWLGSVRMGRLGLGYGQARLWAGKAGWGRLGLGYGQAGWGRLRLGYGQARLWAGRLGQAGARLWAGRLWLGPNGQAGAGWGLAIGRLWLGPNGQAGAGWGSAMGRLGQAVAQSNGQAGARLWAGKAGWGRLGLGPNGQGPLAWLGQNGQAGAGLWAGKAGWGRLRLGYGQAWLWAGKAGWGRLGLGYGQVRQAGAWLWAGKAGWGRLWLGPNGQAGASLGLSPGKHVGVDLKITRTDALRHVVDQNSTGVDRRAGNGLVDGGVNLGIKNLKQHERGKGQSDRRAGHTHTQAEGNWATESIKTEGRPTEDYTRRKIEIPTAGQGRAQLSLALLGWVLGRARLGLAGSRAGRANDLALKNKYKERRGRLGWVLDNLGSLAGGRFDLQKPDKNETSTNSSCPRTPKMEKKPKKEKPPGIEENPPKGKTPPGKETSVKDGFKGKTPLAGKGNTVNFE